MVVFSSTIGNILWCMLALSIIVPYVLDVRRKKARERASAA